VLPKSLLKEIPLGHATQSAPLPVVPNPGPQPEGVVVGAGAGATARVKIIQHRNMQNMILMILISDIPA
jgi:hypothetical protein